MEICCNIKNVFTITFDVSLLNKMIVYILSCVYYFLFFAKCVFKTDIILKLLQLLKTHL